MKIPLMDISIHQTSNPAYNQLQQVLDTLQIPSFKVL